MPKIWKYELKGEVEIPYNNKLLSIQNQSGLLVGWFEVDETKPLENHIYREVLTGREVPENSLYLTTVQFGKYVAHVYEIKL